MQAELLKIRSMPTPFWCAAAAISAFLGGLAVTFAWGVGDELAALGFIEFSTAICSVVLGVWIIGVEYGQNTMRRSLTADPGRSRLILAKVGTVVLVAAAGTALLFALALPLYGFANSGHDFAFPVAELFRRGLAALFSNLVYTLVGVGLAMITASMAGGMTASIVFIFVVDSVLAAVPKVGQYTFGLALADVNRAIVTSSEGGFNDGAGHGVAVGLLLVAGWLLVLLGLGVQRLLNSDVR